MMRLLIILFLSVSCGYQAAVELQPGLRALSGLTITDEVIDSVTLDPARTDADYFDAYLAPIVVSVIDPVSGAPDTRVDYRRLNELSQQDTAFQMNRLKLYRYYRDLQTARLSQDALHATYINAYNFFTLETVLVNYNDGALRSISDIGGEGSFRAFREIYYRFAGESLSLDQIEHERLRPSLNFADGRVHFAVICASIGCPVLLAQAYRGETLNEQLDEVTRMGLRLPRILDLRDGGFKVSQIFDWFLEDFENQSGSVEGFIRQYTDALPTTLPPLDYVEYDWGLNAAR